MSDTTDLLTSRDTQQASGDDASSLPPPYQGEQPPPYSAAKTDTTWTKQSSTGYESFRDIIPERLSDTTPLIGSSSFDDKIVRRAFVRKVFSILTLQLLFTFSVVCVFTFSSVVKDAVQTSLGAYLSSIIIFLVVSLALSYRRDFSRRHPWNISGLVVVTLSLSYMVGTIASFHNTTSVVITMGVTLAVTVAIIVFSAQTRYDFTVCYGVLLILSVDLIMFGIFSTFYSSYLGDIAYGCFGALLYSLFLMIDCQLMMGAMSYRLNPEEYINAALNIYLDVMLIFLYLLGRR
ncbi:protein lifeguard 1-like [Trematomus bernacchii]|uniref:protein lifeguard 1-like n=1 Tax=Trematomus bernacchii TaxID=40690 RepID=UPI00146C6892|nr:protein lifeguard 1-like [Trematomus bernacchii]XP_034008894.1 protein lifeguard 1-like [Trematomus bernacchii]